MMSFHVFHSHNHHGPTPDIVGTFTISASPNTDIWRKPPATHSCNAPIVYTTTTVSSFISARATFTVPQAYQYDQGGLCLIINPSQLSTNKSSWIKTGIEFHNGTPQVSTVVTDRWSDWSLRPPPPATATATTPYNQPPATIEIESGDDRSLWVYLIEDTGEKIPLREITWWADLPRATECWVGVYAARPDPNNEAKDDLHVEFRDLKIVINHHEQELSQHGGE